MTPKIPKLVWTIKDFYNAYEHKDKIDKHTFRLIQKTFNNLLLRSMVEEGKAYRIVSAFGVLGIFTHKGRAIYDYPHYKKTGEKIFYKNLHSNGLVAAIKFKPTARFHPTSTVYKFKSSRLAARKLAKLIKEENYINKYFDYEECFY